MTTRARMAFTVKEGADGRAWIALEPLSGQLRGEGLPSGFFGLELRTGTDADHARAVANYLNEHIEQLTFTAIPLG